jgi:GNAT superfamily N-acetyltransferase
MTEPLEVRPARPDDAAACALILNDWIDATEWMPRSRSRETVREHYRDWVFKERAVFVIGNPVSAYIALSQDHFITSLYCAQPGAGRGKALLDYAKGLRPRLSLWTFVANTGARRFYVRESFVELRRTAGENEENLPDLLYRWDAS